jgi:hypothetical protein
MSLLVFDAAMDQTKAKSGIDAQTVINSTHHYPDGTMTEVLRRAADRGWPIYRWCHKCTMQSDANPSGWLDPAEVERKRGEAPAAVFSCEYDLNEPVPESGAFVPNAVEAMFRPDLGIYRGAPGIGNVVRDLITVPAKGVVLAGRDWTGALSQYVVGRRRRAGRGTAHRPRLQRAQVRCGGRRVQLRPPAT